MRILPVSALNIIKARKIIKQGGIVVYPTETVYGLGVDIFNLSAVRKIFTLKGRKFNKPLSVMVSDFQSLKKLVHLNPGQERLARGLLPGPFTLILRKKKNISKLLTAGTNKLGIRCSPDKFCQQLTKNLPLTATSANLSGRGTTLSIKNLVKDFNGKVNLILMGKKMSGQPSRVINLTVRPIKILR